MNSIFSTYSTGENRVTASILAVLRSLSLDRIQRLLGALHAYVCQPDRAFQQVSHLAFYSKGQIYPLVPKILESFDNVLISGDQYEGVLGQLVDRLIKEQRREEGGRNKILLLSAPESPETIRLSAPIQNDLTSKSGKPTAFTMGQRYVASSKLRAAKTTSDLA